MVPIATGESSPCASFEKVDRYVTGDGRREIRPEGGGGEGNRRKGEGVVVGVVVVACEKMNKSGEGSQCPHYSASSLA